MANQIFSDNMIKKFIPLSDFALALADADQRTTTHSIHYFLFDYLRTKVNKCIRHTIECNLKITKSVFMKIVEKISDLTLNRVKRTQKNWPKFTFTSVYKDLQPWFKDAMRQKIETKLEIVDSKRDLRSELNSQNPVYGSSNQSEPFFSIVD